MLPNPWVILGVVAVWLASLAGVGWWQRHDGALAATNACASQQNAALLAARAEVAKLTKDKEDTEKQHAAELAATGEVYERNREALEAQLRTDVAAARAGALKLRIRASCPRLSGPEAAPAAPAAGRDDAATIELPPEVTGDLYTQAHDADRNTDQLTACQAVAQSYYKACSQ